jgi:peptidoglycan/LPS O-acetylase OafA/YrhL
MVPTMGPRIPGIEGLRALAASSIVLFHLWRYSPSDGVPFTLDPVTRLFPDLAFGVTLFFALSGFLLYRPFVSRLLREQERPSFVRYVRNRALRILPAYWAILLVSALVLQTTLARDSAGALVSQALNDPLVLARTLLLVQNYDPDTVLTGIGPAWSLAVEVVFYLTLPLLVALAYRLARHSRTRAGRRLAALAPAALLLVVGLAGKATAAFVVTGTTTGWGADWNGVLERSFLAQADLFSFGMALAVVHVEAEDGFVRVGRRGRLSLAAGALVAYGVTARTTTFDQLTHTPSNTLMALACALLLALVVLPRPAASPSPLVRFLETRPLVLVGTVSYSLFLLHEPVIRWFHQLGLTLGGGALGFLFNVSVIGLACVALSVLSYRYVEAPALRRKRKSASPQVVVQPASAAP